MNFYISSESFNVTYIVGYEHAVYLLMADYVNLLIYTHLYLIIVPCLSLCHLAVNHHEVLDTNFPENRFITQIL